jgi:hypothetical protein
MKEYIQIIVFDEIMEDNLEKCNKFLENTYYKVKEVRTLYNAVLGGIIYIVLYVKN